MLKFRLKLNNKMRGFTLIEALLSIVILTVSIMAPLTLSMQISKYSRISVMRMDATYFAEEAIEIMYNLKKSAEIHCSDVTSSDCDSDYFDSYFLDPQDAVIPDACKGYLTFNVKRYCNYDLSNLVRSSTDNTVKLVNINSNKVYVEKVSGSTAVASMNPTRFKRSINVTYTDINTTADDTGIVSTATLTSIVCIDEPNECNESSKEKVLLINMLSR